MVYTVELMADLVGLDKPEDGDIAFIAETKKYKIYKEEEGVWDDYNPDINLNLYDMNKSAMANVKNMDWRKVEGVIKKWNPEGTYFLMYCKDIGYFTLFKKDENANEKFHEAFKECLINVGDLKACDIVEDGSGLEIWVKLKETNEMVCMYLFNYDEGVVLVK